MKKYIIIIILLVQISIETNAQTYIQGKDVIPFNTIANSALLSAGGRLDMLNAFNKLKAIDNTTFQKSHKEMTGEFWWVDGMLVQIVTRKITTDNPADYLWNLRYSMRPNVSVMKGNSRDMTLYNDYFEELKTLTAKNFEVLIHYYKTGSSEKKFIIQSNLKGYKILGKVYSYNHEKSYELINKIINDIYIK